MLLVLQVTFEVSVIIFMRPEHDKFETFLRDDTVGKQVELILKIEFVNKNTSQITFLFGTDRGVLDNLLDFMV